MSCIRVNNFHSSDSEDSDEDVTAFSARQRAQTNRKCAEEDIGMDIESTNPLRLQAALGPDDSSSSASLGFSFSGGGFLLPYHIGCIKALRRLSLILPGRTSVGGTSAGSLAAVVLVLGLDEDKVLSSIRDMMADFREHGVYKRLGPRMKETVRDSFSQLPILVPSNNQ